MDRGNHKYIVALAILGALGTTILAFDEGLVRMSLGGATLRDGEDTMLRMESERVVIEIDVNSYTVDAEFVFYNHGSTVTETVGFPNHAFGYANLSTFKGAEFPLEFETWVNGIPQEIDDVPGSMKVRYRNKDAITVTDPEEIGRIRKALNENSDPELFIVWETRWLVKTVTFEGNARTTTRVRYKALYNNFDDGEYYYGSGASWRGSIGKAEFVFRWSPEAWLYHLPVFAESNIYSWTSIHEPEIRRTGEYECEFVLEDFEPLDTEILGFYHSASSDARSLQLWDYGTRMDFAFDDVLVTEDVLGIFSFSQLDLLCHAFEANRGKIFDTLELDTYFRSRFWYSPRTDYVESDLSVLDQENIKLVQSYASALREKLK